MKWLEPQRRQPASPKGSRSNLELLLAHTACGHPDWKTEKYGVLNYVTMYVFKLLVRFKRGKGKYLTGNTMLKVYNIRGNSVEIITI